MQITKNIDRTCDWCGKDPGRNPKNKKLWNGFYDRGTDMRICWNCREDYYKNNKTKSDDKNEITK